MTFLYTLQKVTVPNLPRFRHLPTCARSQKRAAVTRKNPTFIKDVKKMKNLKFHFFLCFPSALLLIVTLDVSLKFEYQMNSTSLTQTQAGCGACSMKLCGPAHQLGDTYESVLAYALSCYWHQRLGNSYLPLHFHRYQCLHFAWTDTYTFVYFVD